MNKKLVTIAVLATLSSTLTGCFLDTTDKESATKEATAVAVANPITQAPAVALPGTVTMTQEQLNAAIASAIQASKPAPVAAAPTRTTVRYVQRPVAVAKPVAPEYEIVTRHVCEPRQITTQVDVQDPIKQEHSGIGMALGGVTGALLGHNVGGGTGRTLATVAGGIGGAFAGDALANNQQERTSHKESRTSTVEVCSDVQEKVLKR